jgi:2,3-diaminopropionate biosynthesis protein SbnB
MNDDEVLILKGGEVLSLLEGQEGELIDIVGRAYRAHRRGASSLPHSLFLRFPDDERNRIIALPAFLGDDFGVAGVKWVSSFPGNLARGMDRASAVVIMNSAETGRPDAIIEGSIVSAKRTAASAALAARHLHPADDDGPVGLVGTGLINFEVVRMLLAARPGARTFVVHDLDPARAAQFKYKCVETFDRVEVCVERDLGAVLRRCSLISFATTAAKPYVADLSPCPEGATILHVSLRDLSPEAILASDNVADDVDHVCRAGTSLHLAEQLVGHRGFVRCTLADILEGEAPARVKSRVVFSPFGLGVLDLAVSQHVRALARSRGVGTSIGGFLPAPWAERL